MKFNEYPYLNLTDLNLDYILNAIREMRYEVTNFVSINAIKYADPIQWTIIRQYEKNTIVIDPVTGTAYISVAPVPSGVALTREEYWTVVFDLGLFVTRAAQNFTSHWESDTTLTATFPTNAGGWLVWGNVLYKALVNITAGDQYVIGSNIQHFTIEDLYNEYLNTIASIVNIIGDLAELETSDTSNIVHAINSILNTTIGNLDDLNTSVKDSIVNAINSVLSDYAQEINTGKLFVGEDIDSWVANHRGHQYNNDTLLSVSPVGKTGVAGFTRTKDNPNSFDYGTIAVTGIAQSDKEESDTCVSWGGYFENRRIGDSSTAYGIEVDSGRFDTTQEAFNPYDSSSDQNMCVTANLSSGCGDSDSNGADTALWIHKNPKAFKQGIIFSGDAVEQGRPYIGLPWTARISWQAGANDSELQQFITGADLYLHEITQPYFPKINLNGSDGLNDDAPEHATLGAIQFANNGNVKAQIRGTEDNGGTITFLLPNSKYVVFNQYWVSAPDMWVNCDKLQAVTAEVSGAVSGGTVAGSSAFIDKSYKAGLHDHSVPTSTVRAIATALKNALKPVWVNNKCSVSVKREDIITIFSNNGWDATATNLLTGANQEYVDQSELALWISYAP